MRTDNDRRRDRVAIAWLITFSLIFGAILPGTVPQAQALDVARQITVRIGWSNAGCLDITEPNPDMGRAALMTSTVCSYEDGAAVTYLSRPGQWYGAKVEAPGAGVACIVEVGARVTVEITGNDTADCLVRW